MMLGLLPSISPSPENGMVATAVSLAIVAAALIAHMGRVAAAPMPGDKAEPVRLVTEITVSRRENTPSWRHS